MGWEGEGRVRVREKGMKEAEEDEGRVRVKEERGQGVRGGEGV